MIDWRSTPAAVWRGDRAALHPVRNLDRISFATLVGIDRQRQALCRNTERFLAGLPANNALLWGARGTGKSSLIKALLNAYAPKGLRLVEVDRDDLVHLPEIVDAIHGSDHRFVIFCDDLSFQAGERHYRALKRTLEGSIELPPPNIILYATSNRRHLLPESMRDNHDSEVVDGELHPSDQIEEILSLSDRFGLSLSFHPIGEAEFLSIVDSYFAGWHGDREWLHVEARKFARARGTRSGRIARQFFNQFWEER